MPAVTRAHVPTVMSSSVIMCIFNAVAVVLAVCVFYLVTAECPKDEVKKKELEIMTLRTELATLQQELLTLRAELVRLHLQDVECQAFRKRIWEHVTDMQRKRETKMTRHAHSWHGSSYTKYQSI